jgi:hypothetical protein
LGRSQVGAKNVIIFINAPQFDDKSATGIIAAGITTNQEAELEQFVSIANDLRN